MASLCIISSAFQLLYNGNYDYTSFNNLSSNVMDHCPSLYTTFCKSTFFSRANHVDGAYNQTGYTYYLDSDTGELRKLLYCSSTENTDKILHMLESDTDQNLENIRKELLNDKSGKYYYINLSRYEENQYRVKEVYKIGLVNLVQNSYYQAYYDTISIDDAEKFAQSLYNGEESAYQELAEWIDNQNYSDNEYVHRLYLCVFGREENQAENQMHVQELENGVTRYELLQGFVRNITGV